MFEESLRPLSLSLESLSGDSADIMLSFQLGEPGKIRVSAELAPLGVPLGVKLTLPPSASLDYWAVDWEHDGHTFRGGFHALREKRSAPLPLEAVHVYREAGEKRIAVQRVDASGNEARKILRWKSPG